MGNTLMLAENCAMYYKIAKSTHGAHTHCTCLQWGNAVYVNDCTLQQKYFVKENLAILLQKINNLCAWYFVFVP